MFEVKINVIAPSAEQLTISLSFENGKNFAENIFARCAERIEVTRSPESPSHKFRWQSSDDREIDLRQYVYVLQTENN
jgi:hypothetical protein